MNANPSTSRPQGAAPATRAASNRRALLLAAVALVALIAAVLLLAQRLRVPELHGTLLQSPQPVQDFTLTASTGEPVSLSDLRGKHVALYFGYTYCPDVCPTTLNDLRKMVNSLSNRQAQDVQVIMISVDPERDTVEQLASYLKHIDPNFLGMTGAPQEIKAVASQMGAFFEKRETEGATGYLVDHTSTTLLIDERGFLRLVWPYGTAGADMAADLSWLMGR